jgi:hypothetical protein
LRRSEFQAGNGTAGNPHLLVPRLPTPRGEWVGESAWSPQTDSSFSGVLSEYTKTADSGDEVTRQFCPKCGTHLFGKSSNRPEFRVVRAGNLDEPSSIQPNMNIWVASAPGWACLNPAIERVERQPMPPK